MLDVNESVIQHLIGLGQNMGAGGFRNLTNLQLVAQGTADGGSELVLKATYRYVGHDETFTSLLSDEVAKAGNLPDHFIDQVQASMAQNMKDNVWDMTSSVPQPSLSPDATIGVSVGVSVGVIILAAVIGMMVRRSYSKQSLVEHAVFNSYEESSEEEVDLLRK